MCKDLILDIMETWVVSSKIDGEPVTVELRSGKAYSKRYKNYRNSYEVQMLLSANAGDTVMIPIEDIDSTISFRIKEKFIYVSDNNEEIGSDWIDILTDNKVFIYIDPDDKDPENVEVYEEFVIYVNDLERDNDNDYYNICEYFANDEVNLMETILYNEKYCPKHYNGRLKIEKGEIE